MEAVARCRPGEATGNIPYPWVPSHEKPGSDKIAEIDIIGNEGADALVKHAAKTAGPTALQSKLYEASLAQCAIIQDIPT
eukprot:11121491-Heterocapsa_arctica.AAC.1